MEDKDVVAALNVAGGVRDRLGPVDTDTSLKVLAEAVRSLTRVVAHLAGVQEVARTKMYDEYAVKEVGNGSKEPNSNASE